MLDAADTPERTPDQRRIAELEALLQTRESELAESRTALERLRNTYARALEQLQLMRRRLFVAKAERIDDNADQLAFDKMFEEVQRLEKELETAEGKAGAKDSKGDGSKPADKPKSPPTGRRDLSKSALPVISVEILDPELEGKAQRIGTEVSWRLGYERGGMRRIELSRAVYKVEEPNAPVTTSTSTSTQDDDSAPATRDESTTTDTPARLITAALPKELFHRGLLAPSLIAHLLVAKYMMGTPFYRLEQKCALEGEPLDRGTMCRYAEDAGATLGAIVEAARAEAFETAFCLSTDATGVCIQPEPLPDGKRQPCRKGHFFVVLADRDHVFFEYQEKHTSAAVCEMFKGYTGYVQADAHAVYDALFRGTPPKGVPPDEDRGPPPTEVACWSHARRKYWEAAVCKHDLGLEGLRRIDAIFAADRLLKDAPPSKRKTWRDSHVRPLVETFFNWLKAVHATPRERGLVASALGYTVNQETALRRFLDDGRLRLENNAAERALRTIAVGRKNWLFCGSDDHASAAANIFSLVASCKLHGLDPEAYLETVIRVMPYWPRDRYIELAPKYWAATRARLVAKELELPLGDITVPAPLPASEKRAAD